MVSYSAAEASARGPRPRCAPHFPAKAEPGRKGTDASAHDAGWTVRLPAALDIAAIPPNYLKMLLVLERACRDRSYCWNSNASLAALYGAENSGGFRRLLADMRRDGYIATVPVHPDRPGDGRLGIFLLKRLDPDRPVEDAPPSPDAVARLWAARERKGEPVRCPARATTPAPIEATPLPQMGPPPLPQMRPQNKDVFSNKDERNDDGVVVASSRPPEEEKGPEGAAADLGPLIARAEERFGGCMSNRVVNAVDVYGLEWVCVVLWGVLTLRDWGGVLATLGHWKAEGGPSNRTVERARRERAKSAPRPEVEHRPAVERSPAEVLMAEIRREGFGLEIGAGGRLELIDPEPAPLEGPRPLAERLRRWFEASVERSRVGFRSRLDGLEAEVIALLRDGPWAPEGSPEGVAVAGPAGPVG